MAIHGACLHGNRINLEVSHGKTKEKRTISGKEKPGIR